MSNAVPKSYPDDDAETALLEEAVEEARAAQRAGAVVSHERVRAWLLELAEGKRPAPPQP